MDKRGRRRTKRRLAVRFGVDRAEKLGFVADVSRGGLYVETNAVFPPGTTLRLEVSLPSGPLPLVGRVARGRRLPPSLMHTLRGGMGIQLEDPPQAWTDAVAFWESGQDRAVS